MCDDKVLKHLGPYISKKSFEPANVAKSSTAAAALAIWVLSIAAKASEQFHWVDGLVVVEGKPLPPRRRPNSRKGAARRAISAAPPDANKTRGNTSKATTVAKPKIFEPHTLRAAKALAGRPPPAGPGRTPGPGPGRRPASAPAAREPQKKPLFKSMYYKQQRLALTKGSQSLEVGQVVADGTFDGEVSKRRLAAATRPRKAWVAKASVSAPLTPERGTVAESTLSVCL